MTLYDLYIPIGSNCYVADKLRSLNLRKQAYPFDWNAVNYEYGLTYFINLIKNNFTGFLDDLRHHDEVNHRGACYSVNYPLMSFAHYDIINNYLLGSTGTDDFIKKIDLCVNIILLKIQ